MNNLAIFFALPFLLSVNAFAEYTFLDFESAQAAKDLSLVFLLRIEPNVSLGNLNALLEVQLTPLPVHSPARSSDNERFVIKLFTPKLKYTASIIMSSVQITK